MSDLTERIAALSPEQRALFEAKLKKRGLSAPQPQVIPRRKQQNYCRLSFDQERIWIVDQMEPGNPAYNIFSVSNLFGHLDAALMERALNEIVRRHEVLRTTFTAIDGEPRQVISPSLFIPLELIDLRAVPVDVREREVTRLVNESTSQPFDLARGPLARFGLIRIADDEHILHYTVHHSVIDRWSADIIEVEMAAIYTAFAEGRQSPLLELPIQYADFAEWQREWLQGEVLEEQVAYWRKQLDGIPHVLELPTDRPRPPIQTFKGARRTTVLPKHILDSLKALSRQEQATMFMTCLAAFKTLLYRYTNQEDILVGVAVANRSRPETLGLIGYFLNMLVMRTNFSGNPTFREVLRREKAGVTNDFAHSEFPFGRLMQEIKPKMDPSRNPLFQVAYIYLDFEMKTDAQAAGFTPTPMPWDNGHSRFDMTLALTDSTDSLEVIIEFNTDLFEMATIERTLGHFRCMVEAIIADPDTPVSGLPLLTAPERRRLLNEWNGPITPYPQHKSIHQLFEEQVALTPDAVALEFENQQLTYVELNRRANQLAHYLRRMGIREESAVGIMMERGLEMIVSLLGVLKAGGAYVPLDPEYPPERLAFMLTDAGVRVLLSQSSLLPRLPPVKAEIICLDEAWPKLSAESEENPESEISADHLAYITYTSGSTGQPKGVQTVHRGVVRLVKGNDYARLDAGEVFLQFASLAFDASTFEIWGSLLNGARLVVMPAGLPTLEELGQALKRHRVTVLWLTAGLFNLMVDEQLEDLRGLRQLLAGGDVLSVSHVQRFLHEVQDCTLVNGYGPTESTTFACCHRMNAAVEFNRTVPIGRPIANTQVYILDTNLQPVVIGAIGQLYIGGDGLARGYLNRPAQTARSFIPHPFSQKPGAQLYNTGDLARYLPNGDIEFLGRIDNQVKVRGFRIEPGEIESALASHEAVRDALVVARADEAGEKQLVAYVVGASGEEVPGTSQLRQFLRERLPEHMIPSLFISLDQFPLTINGKVDYRALPAPSAAQAVIETAFVAPSTMTEEILARIWSKVLSVKRISIHDNFFELGGNSLSATQLVSQVRHTLEVELPLRDLFQYPTIAQLAVPIEEALIMQVDELTDQEAEEILKDSELRPAEKIE
jgi:aspartate racemase